MFVKLERNVYQLFCRAVSFLRPRKKIGIASFVILVSLFVSAWFIFTPAAQAGVGDWLLETFSSLLFALAGFFIKLTFFVLKFIIEVAGYNGFIDSPAVTVGWVMIRDLTNMFFVVVLLMIAFGTILGLEHYEYKHLLVKLVVAAVLVNFSRLICGLIIDLAQIVMITFINGIAATASGNLVNMFQVDKIFKLGNGQAATGTPAAIFVAAVAAIAFSVIMLVTMLAFLFIIVARMAMLWVLIVVSPFAFVLNILHQTEHFAHEWWGKFTSNVISGPIIAFFLWLSFVTVGSGNIHDDIVKHNALQQGQLLQQGVAEEEQTGLTQIMSWENMANFIIAIAILLVGAHMAEELGVAGAHMMGSAGELGKKVAMYASGFQAAKWIAPQIGKGLYYGSNMIPGLAGIHPEAWKRRAGNIKSRAKSWYYDHKVGSTVKAGEISKAFAVNKKGKYVKKTQVARQDKEGNIMKDEHGNILYDEKEVEQKGFFDWARRQWARGRLEMGAGYDAFHHAYSEDLEATAEAKHEQLDHLASTSSLPIGLEKQKAKEWLEFLEHTGANIKAGKVASMEEQREKIMHILEHEEGDEADEKLKDLGLSKLEIFKAKQGYGRFGKSVKAKAEAEVAEEYLAAEHKIKELEQLGKILEGKKGAHADEAKAMAEQLNFDIQQMKQLQLARARDATLRKQDRYTEANNEENTLNEQAEQRMKRHSAAADYVQSVAKTTAQLNRIEEAKGELEEAIANNNKEKIPKIEETIQVLKRSLSEMVISNLGTHAAIADGNKGKILAFAEMPAVQSMELNSAALMQLQAQDLAEMIGERVQATEKGLKEAIEKLGKIHGEQNLNAILEQKRLRNEKAAGQGSIGRAGLYSIRVKNDGTRVTELTNVSESSGVDYVESRRKAGLSGSKMTNVSGFSGSMDKIESKDSEGNTIVVSSVASEPAKQILINLAAGLTGNNLGSVDEYTKGDLAEVLDNTKDLAALLQELSKSVNDTRALKGLLGFTLEKGRMKNDAAITAVRKMIEELGQR